MKANHKLKCNDYFHETHCINIPVAFAMEVLTFYHQTEKYFPNF